jgi:hypothetical protein
MPVIDGLSIVKQLLPRHELEGNRLTFFLALPVTFQLSELIGPGHR